MCSCFSGFPEGLTREDTQVREATREITLEASGPRRHTLEGCMSTRLREWVCSHERQSPGRKLGDPHPQQGWGGPHHPRTDSDTSPEWKLGRQGKKGPPSGRK